MKAALTIIFLVSFCYSKGQISDSLVSWKYVNPKAIAKIEKDINSLNSKVEKNTVTVLRQIQRQENILKRKLQIKDSIAAKELFSIEAIYTNLNSRLKGQIAVNKGPVEYIPEMDSLTSGIKFLRESATFRDRFPKEWTVKINSTSKSIEGLQDKFHQAEHVKEFLNERRRLLKEQLQKFGMNRELKKLNKKVYYYQQQIREYKELLKDRKKIEQRAIAELRSLPAFTEFMKKNSQLAQLFRLPDNYGTSQSLTGLQTRASVQGWLQTRFASTGINPQQYIEQQMGVAQAELNKLKDKINKAGGGSDDIEMPDFKPNSQKTKTFLKRMEYGVNLQSQKTNAFLPVTSDLALTAGYKLNDKSVIGVGASYKVGWGSGWQQIKFTNEGIGLRSYVDIKLRASIWISGGYEQNYQVAFSKIDQLKDLNNWQTSGLLGLTKKYKIAKKTNNLQLLWDFLSYQQVPRRQAVLFRVGYVF